jgi:hypothetical protein
MRKTHTKGIITREARMALRNMPNQIETIYDKRGNMVCLNTVKHALLQRPYKNAEYAEEMTRSLMKLADTLENKETVKSVEIDNEKPQAIIL